MSFDVSGVDWVTLGIGLAVLAVAWVVLKSVLKITSRIFTLGCTGLIVLGLIGAALIYLR
jgi:hypothetical protein